jgi:PAS domain S-box-containing protein
VRTQPTHHSLDRSSTSESTARALVAAIPDPIFRIGIDGIYRGFKVDSEHDLLTPPDEVIGRSVQERLPAHIAEGVLAAGRRAVENGVLERVEYSLEIRGELRDYEGRIVACGHDEFLVIVRDFTERTRQAQELERERDFSYAVVRSTPSFLALVDDTGTMLGVNRALERAAGLPEESWLGLPFWKVFLAEEDAPRARVDFERMLQGDPPGVVEYHHVSVEGEHLVVDWTATEVPGEDGERRYLLCGLDVTARKHVEDEIRRSRARIVSASDAERKRLERNLHDGAQQHLVSVSHAVHLGVRFMRTDPDQAEQHLERALLELNAAHDELRELARGLHPQILTVRGLATAVRALAGRAPIPVTVVTTDDADRWPAAVESAAYYVVAEALTNVVKYSGASSATIRVRNRGDALIVEIADDGRGGARASEGSGLGGLKDRVEALDGTFSVESTTGSGTRIRAEFPLLPERAEVPA